MLENILKQNSSLTLSSVPDGAEGFFLSKLSAILKKPLLFIARDAQKADNIKNTLPFFMPGVEIIEFPAWDCVPYDRVSPNADIVAQRMAALSRLTLSELGHGSVILTTINAALQRIPPKDYVSARSIDAVPGRVMALESLTNWAAENGYERTPTVRVAGEFAVRGGLVDLFPAGREEPVRLDFFGDTLETIRTFDPETQRTTGQLKHFSMIAANEAIIDEQSVKKFRQNYLANFGAAGPNDSLYHAISEKRRYPGMEHWLSFFHDHLVTLFEYLPDVPVITGMLVEDAAKERLEQVQDHYQARVNALDEAVKEAVPYHPVPPEKLYLSQVEWATFQSSSTHVSLSSFEQPEKPDVRTFDPGARVGRSFAAERVAAQTNIFEAVSEHVKTLKDQGKKVAIAAWSDGSADRLTQVLKDHHLDGLTKVENWKSVTELQVAETAVLTLPIEMGFVVDDVAVIAEQDILGDRLVRQTKRSRKASDVLTEAASLSIDDYVVHIDHGIGQFKGLKTIDAAGAPHDCLELIYHGGDKLYLPVENIELLSRFGSGSTTVQLDKLGGVAWQAKKSRLKKRILEIANDLIRVAAERQLKKAERFIPPDGLFEEFCARFPFEETEDQFNSIEAVFDDLGSGRPMDRLICGDVGFGKTEVALRAAFVVAMSGRQVAVVVPTTLLSRQHTKTFETRFNGLPIRVKQASRLVSSKELSTTKKEIKDGTVDIVVGTHALLGKSINFRDLGLLIIDEEQHFGVKHKERLKELKSEVHVLTLSATPIPRTLQLSLTGVRELSLIATPPVDRLAVRTFISPFDPVVIREALLREHYRGGQSFYVVPRISDLSEISDFLDSTVPEVRYAVAHGQMPPGQLDELMNNYYDGKFDVLLSTTIVESGLDVPKANTLIIHRSEMFGLAQLYQLRGRVGRSKTRAYALFTTPANRKLTPTAERRLKVLQSLDGLGAGFTLASHDMDIRGAGNLLGEEQSGNIKEVGYELYQQMLEEAVSSLKTGEETTEQGQWSPQITVGTSVMIPESYVADLHLRMSLYRRLADLSNPAEIDAFAAELIDRFGPLPDEVDSLLKIVFIKGLCRTANIEKIDAGPRGALITIRNNEFPDPAGLIKLIQSEGSLAKIRPDQRIYFSRDWPKPKDRLKGSAVLMARLAKIAKPA